MDKELKKYLVDLLTTLVSVGDEMLDVEDANPGVLLEHLKVKSALEKLKLEE